MQALGAKEMGGKTGTTNSNADFWFMGYTPQLLAGAWVGCDDRFITIESAAFYGGTAARPIWQAFFKKVYDDRSLGIDRNAEFVKPAEMHNELNNADMMRIIDESGPGTESQEGYNADDYTLDTTVNIPAESQLPVDEDGRREQPAKKDTSKRAAKIGEAPPTQEEPKEKKGFFKRLFGGKDDKKKEEAEQQSPPKTDPKKTDPKKTDTKRTENDYR
jgi:penicillin-binding protein 1A